MSLILDTTNGILNFINEGKTLEGISIGDQKNLIFEKLGKKSKIIGDELSGFIEFKSGVRFRYVDDIVDELGIIFTPYKKAKFPILIESIPGEHFISRNKTIGEVILILAHTKIQWRSWDEHSINYLSIRTAGDVLLLFDLDTSKLERIVYIGERLIRNN